MSKPYWLPLQQPLQLPGPHWLLSTQTPCVQLSVLLQVWQAIPPWPQAEIWSPFSQVDPLQQPLQVVAEQPPIPVQVPLRQTWLLVHVLQA